MMVAAASVAIFAIGAIAVVGYVMAEALIVMLEVVTKVTEELRQ
jgi:hypothetical protein